MLQCEKSALSLQKNSEKKNEKKTGENLTSNLEQKVFSKMTE